MTGDLVQDRQRFAELAVEYWWLLRSGAPAEDANASAARADRLAAAWDDRLDELLGPLLADGSAEVRYTAATQLHRYAPSDRTREVLEAVARGNHGQVSAAARLLWTD